MYQLTCPSCGRTTQWPFVRVGASRRCESCGTRSVVDRSHVTRHNKAQGNGRTLLDAQAGADVPPRVDEQGNVIGLSGLTEMMQREPRPRVAAPEADAPPAAAVRRSSVQAVKTQHRRRDVRWLYILLGLMVALMILLGFSIWFATNISGTTGPRFPTHDATEHAPEVAPGSPAPPADRRPISD